MNSLNPLLRKMKMIMISTNYINESSVRSPILVMCCLLAVSKVMLIFLKISRFWIVYNIFLNHIDNTWSLYNFLTVPSSPLKKQPSKESVNSQPRSTGSAAALLPEEPAAEEELIISTSAPSSFTGSPQLIHRNPSVTSSSGEAKLGRVQLTIRYSMQRQKLTIFVHKVA